MKGLWLAAALGHHESPAQLCIKDVSRVQAGCVAAALCSEALSGTRNAIAGDCRKRAEDECSCQKDKMTSETPWLESSG